MVFEKILNCLELAIKSGNPVISLVLAELRSPVLEKTPVIRYFLPYRFSAKTSSIVLGLVSRVPPSAP